MQVRGELAGSTATDASLAGTIASAGAAGAHAEEAELYRRFAPRVRLFGLRHLRDEAAAQDLVQQVFVVVIERLRAGEVRNHGMIASFILGTCRTIVQAGRRMDAHRQALTVRFAERDAIFRPRDEWLDAPRLDRCLESLPVRDRTILVLTFYAERRAEEIASEMGLALGAVRVARHRALAKLRECVMSRGVLEK